MTSNRSLSILLGVRGDWAVLLASNIRNSPKGFTQLIDLYGEVLMALARGARRLYIRCRLRMGRTRCLGVVLCCVVDSRFIAGTYLLIQPEMLCLVYPRRLTVYYLLPIYMRAANS